MLYPVGERQPHYLVIDSEGPIDLENVTILYLPSEQEVVLINNGPWVHVSAVTTNRVTGYPLHKIAGRNPRWTYQSREPAHYSVLDIILLSTRSIFVTFISIDSYIIVWSVTNRLLCVYSCDIILLYIIVPAVISGSSTPTKGLCCRCTFSDLRVLPIATITICRNVLLQDYKPQHVTQTAN